MFQAKWMLLTVAAVLITANAFDLDEPNIEELIVQGQNATRGQFPYYVFLEIQMKQGKAACGGSLISNQFVVTAGHCLKGASGVNVHLGSLRAKDTKEEGRKIIPVTKNGLYLHPKFFIFLALNDIGLIKLPEPVEFTDIIKPVELACSSTSGMDVVAIGNGITKNTDKTIAPILQYTELKTITMLQCVIDYPILLFRKSVICAEGVQQRSVCRGDSGGPLVTADSNKLVGISSFVNIQGCELGIPQGFTRVASHLEWIKEVTGVECTN